MVEIRHGPLPGDTPREPPIPGTYYRNVSGEPDGPIPVGELVLVMRVDEDTVEFSCRGDVYEIEIDRWHDSYRLAPEGAEERNRELQALLQESPGQQQMRELLSSGSPLRLPGQASGTDVGDQATGSALVAVNAKAAAEVREAMGELRRRAERVELSVRDRQEKIQALVKEQELAIRAQAEAAQEMLKRSQDTLAALDLYLGSGHVAHILLDGEPADENEPFCFHQRVLFMDEEVAAALDDGGITGRDLDKFDEWVKKPENLRRVLPEQRGVVAFRVRRASKRYHDDPLVNWYLNRDAGNFETYLLFRNGDRLMRLWSGFEVRERLMPIRSEWEEVFTDRFSGRVLRPGDFQYREALKRASGLQRYYMSVLLLVQGIIDRTNFLDPLPSQGINLFRVYDEHGPVRFIPDAEESLMLPTGHPPFAEWLREAQDACQVGMRVVGAFSGWDSELRRYVREGSRGNERLSPPNAEYPSSNEIYTIDERDGQILSFLYARREEIWDPDEWESRLPRKRARCTLEVGDNFWVPLDTVSIEDARWYLDSRTERHNYLWVLPLLHRLIAIREQEEREEAPFRELLTGEILKEIPSLEEKAARVLVDECVPWYKFANRTHRALLTDDVKALRMIVTEARIRHARAMEREKRATDAERLVSAVLAVHPDAVLIAHKRVNEYVVLVPENDEQVFVREQVWTTARGRAPILKSEKRWRVVDQRRLRWEVLNTSERWDRWACDARPQEHLTDPERQPVFELGWRIVQEYAANTRNRRAELDFRPVAVYVAPDRKLWFVYKEAAAQIPPDNRLLTGTLEPPGVCGLTLQWQRRRGQIEIGRDSWYSGATIIKPPDSSRHDADPPKPDWLLRRLARTYHGKPHGWTCAWLDKEAVEAIEADWRVYADAKARARELNAPRYHFMAQVRNEIRQAMEQKAFEEWMAEQGDEGLWPAHRRTLRFEPPVLDRFERALKRVLEEGVDVDGMTVGEVLAEGVERGAEPQPGDRDADCLPLDLVLQREVPETLPARPEGQLPPAGTMTPHRRGL